MFRIVGAVLTVWCLSGLAEAIAADPPADLSGRYKCEGTEFDGDTYTGEVVFKKHGATYLITWDVFYRTKNLAGRFEGVGIRTDRVVSATWPSPGNPGVMAYRIQDDGSLVGRWTLRGQEETRSESLVPIK